MATPDIDNPPSARPSPAASWPPSRSGSRRSPPPGARPPAPCQDQDQEQVPSPPQGCNRLCLHPRLHRDFYPVGCMRVAVGGGCEGQEVYVHCGLPPFQRAEEVRSSHGGGQIIILNLQMRDDRRMPRTIPPGSPCFRQRSAISRRLFGSTCRNRIFFCVKDPPARGPFPALQWASLKCQSPPALPPRCAGRVTAQRTPQPKEPVSFTTTLPKALFPTAQELCISAAQGLPPLPAEPLIPSFAACPISHPDG